MNPASVVGLIERERESPAVNDLAGVKAYLRAADLMAVGRLDSVVLIYMAVFYVLFYYICIECKFGKYHNLDLGFSA